MEFIATALVLAVLTTIALAALWRRLPLPARRVGIVFIAATLATATGLHFNGGDGAHAVRVDRPDLGFRMHAPSPYRDKTAEKEWAAGVCAVLERSEPCVTVFVRVECGAARTTDQAADDAFERRRRQERKLTWLERRPLVFGGQPGVLLVFHDQTPGVIIVPGRNDYFFCWTTARGPCTYEFVACGNDRAAVEREAQRVFSTIRLSDVPGR